MRKTRWLAGLLALALMFTMVPSLTMAANATAQIPFWDVIGGAYETPVTALYQIGVVSGTSASTYSPKEPVTRAQMAALLIRALNRTKTATGDKVAKFADVPLQHWAFGEVMLAEELGIVRGVSDTEFRPDAPVTYPQAAVMALRALGYDYGQLEYPTGYVILANELGFIEGLNWSLNGEMNRGEVAVLLANTIFKVTQAVNDTTLSQLHFHRAVSIEVRPSADVLVTGSSKLSVIGKDAYGFELANLTTSWRVTDGIATVSESGLLHATSGSVTVEASIGSLKTTHTYRILSGLGVNPTSATAKPGDKVQLKAVNAQNNSEEVTGAKWEIESGPATIDQAGRLSVTGSGTIVAKATVDSLTARATISALTGLVIAPATTVLTPGQSVTFALKRPDGTAFTGPVQWSVSGSGIITQDGKFTATAGTPPTVKATSGALEGTAVVQVVHRLTVEPSSVSLQQTRTQQFTAKGITTDGKELDLPVTWANSRGIGVVGGTGTFVATGAGTGTVTAKYGELQQNASVSVSGPAATIEVTASRASVPANGRSPITLSAKVKDATGIVVNTATPIQFLLSDGTKGTISEATVSTVAGVATTTVTPSTATGTFTITAGAVELAVTPGFVSLSTYSPTPAKIRLSASPNPLASAVNSRSSIIATLLDSEGYEIANSTGSSQIVTLNYVNTTAATLSSNTIYISPNQSRGEVAFVAGNPGDTVLHAAANYPVEPLTVRTMVAGPAAKLAIRSDIVSTRADGTTEMMVYVEVQDANGVVRTQDYGAIVTLRGLLEDGVTTLSERVTSTQGGVATFRVTSTKAGKFTFTASGGMVASDTETATFTAGVASRLKLSVTPTNTISADALSTVKLRAEIVDSQNNVVPTGSGNITFVRTVNNSATTLPATNTIAATNGVAELALTASVFPGTDSYKATMSGLADSDPVSVTARITGMPSKILVEPVSSSTTAGNNIQIKVYVQDSQGYTVTNLNNRSIRLVTSSPTATVVGSGQTAGGVATFTVSDTKVGTVNLTATGDGLQSDGSKALIFSQGPAAKIVLKATSDELSADAGLSYIQLTAETQDSYGNPVTQSLPITLSMDQSNVVTLSSTFLYTGNYIMVRGTQVPGTVMISGAGSLPIEPLRISTFIPGPPAKVKVESVNTGIVGSPATFRVKVLDANGHTLTNLHTGAYLSGAGVIITGSSEVTTQTITNTNLTGLVNFNANGKTRGGAALSSGVATFSYSSTKAETISVTPVVYYNGQPLTAEAGQVTMRPGNAVKMLVTPSRTGLSTSRAESATLEAVLMDFYDNPVVTTESDTFTAILSTTAYLNTGSQLSIPTTNGRATIQVTSNVHGTGGSTVITFTSTKTGISGSKTIFTDNAPSTPILFATDSSGLDTIVSPVEQGVRVVVTVEPRNSEQTVTAYLDGMEVALYANPDGTSLSSKTIPVGQTSLVAYIRRADMGFPGTKTLRVVVQNAVAPSPFSNTQTLTLQ